MDPADVGGLRVSKEDEMTEQFKKGDVVRCHDFQGTNLFPGDQEYTVRKFNNYAPDHQTLCFDEAGNGEYMACRFALVRSASQPDPNRMLAVGDRGYWGSPELTATVVAYDPDRVKWALRFDCENFDRSCSYDLTTGFWKAEQATNQNSKRPSDSGNQSELGDQSCYGGVAPSHGEIGATSCKSCGKDDQRGLTDGFCCYCVHRDDLVQKLRAQGRWYAGKDLDTLVAASMLIEDSEPDKWAGEKTSPRERLVAALAAELDDGPGRRARLHPPEGRSDRVYLANRKP